ncbi:MFS transporter [Trebonia kvetii]|uniref:MFS transporter n=1 Tax=Trebonia kvetii TaxID=2480626 RepID=A0A6P2BSZ2_9ACTN|nr:MFS transporter [Trebonia kvetii]TVZ02182.1 MFS transporter [Trebonia kvetii]
MDEAVRARAERPTRYYMLVVGVIALVIGNANFEFTLIGGAFPNIAVAFHTTQVLLVMTVVFVASLVFLPITGKLGDIYGKKKMLLVVSVLFAIGSVLCAVAPVYWLFLVGRVLQSSFVVAYVAGYGLVRDLLPRRLVPLGVGWIGAGTGIAVLAGPLLGGWLIDSYGFRSAFWFELIYDVAAGLLVLFVVPESPVRIKRKVDYAGGLLLGVGIAVLVYGVVYNWAIPFAFPVAAVLLIAFAAVERRTAEPLMSLRLLGKPKVWYTLLAASVTIFAIQVGPNALAEIVRIPRIPGVLDQGLGWSAWQYGIYAGLPFGLVGALTGLLAGWMSRRYSPRLVLLIAGVGGLVPSLIAATSASGAAVFIVIAALQGVGLGFLYAAANNLVIEAVPADSQGVGTSMLYTALGTMNAVSTAIIGTITAAHTVPVGSGAAAAFIVNSDGFRISFLVMIGTSVAGLLLTLAMRHGRQAALGGEPVEDIVAVPQEV